MSTELVRRSSSTKNSSFRIKRIGGNIVVCEVCGQGHELGKNHLYDYPDNVDETLLCALCVQALANPVDAPCGHTFCGSCLSDHMRTRRVCPLDGQTLREKDVKPSSMLVCRLLDRLNVVCPNNAYCDQVMARSALETHLQLHCAGAYTSCPREEAGCSYIGPRSQLEEHLWNCLYGRDVDRKSKCMCVLCVCGACVCAYMCAGALVCVFYYGTCTCILPMETCKIWLPIHFALKWC